MKEVLLFIYANTLILSILKTNKNTELKSRAFSILTSCLMSSTMWTMPILPWSSIYCNILQFDSYLKNLSYFPFFSLTSPFLSHMFEQTKLNYKDLAFIHFFFVIILISWWNWVNFNPDSSIRDQTIMTSPYE